MFMEPFEGPELKLERALYHLDDMARTIGEYQLRARPTFVKTDRAVDPWELRLGEPIPKIVCVQIGDIAHSLRSALDVMLIDIAAHRGVGVSDLHYPFAHSEQAFSDMLAGTPRKQPFLRLGPDVVALIEQSRPFKGGNTLLRSLHDLNIQDKHRMAVPIAQFVSTSAAMIPPHQLAPGIRVLQVGGFPVGITEGEPLPTALVGDDPYATYTINDSPMIICFPREFVIDGNVLTKMAHLADATAEMIETFRIAVLGS